jgi:hypothetical protein
MHVLIINICIHIHVILISFYKIAHIYFLVRIIVMLLFLFVQ